MAGFRIPKGCRSRRSIATQFGMNQRTIINLVSSGVLVSSGPAGSAIVEASLDNLREGEHFVSCLECGGKQANISTKHLKFCSGLTLSQYKSKWPDANLASSITQEKKKKTEDQKRAQSETLRLRFTTPEGEETRKQIAEASRRMQDSGYREKAARHLTQYNQSLEARKRVKYQSLKLWKDHEFIAKQSFYKENNRSDVLKSAARARGFIKRTFSKLHQKFEEAMVEAGVEGFQREFLVGYYHVDEAFPDVKLAVEVDGCYWHGCPTCGLEPNPDIAKLDKRKTTYLLNHGWTLIRVPEHDSNDFSLWVSKVIETLESLRGIHATGS
jgi:very-short-patch-repair endonuclease